MSTCNFESFSMNGVFYIRGILSSAWACPMTDDVDDYNLSLFSVCKSSWWKNNHDQKLLLEKEETYQNSSSSSSFLTNK
jgi:hypothetical protein